MPKGNESHFEVLRCGLTRRSSHARLRPRSGRPDQAFIARGGAGVSVFSNRRDKRVVFGLLIALVAAGTVAACASDAWLDESNPSGNHFFDPRVAREIRSFWYVSAANRSLRRNCFRDPGNRFISPGRAASLIGRVPDVPARESLYLIRAMPCRAALYSRLSGRQCGGASAGTNSTCFRHRSSASPSWWRFPNSRRGYG